MVWRLIIDTGRDPYWNMAIDEALLILRENGLIHNTLRIYWFKPSSVTIGYFQKVSDSVDEDYASTLGVPYTRRITGGGSVYHDENGELTYSVIASLNDFPRDPIERYRVICSGLVRAIEYFGLRGEFKPINDVLINNKKVSGSAQTWRKNAFLQHGTFMYNTDLDKLAHVLKAPKEKLSSRGLVSIKERVTTISIELGRIVTRDEALKALIEGFKNALNVDFQEDSLSSLENRYAEELVNKYRSLEWIRRK
uniref:Lipoate--protein ligase family protein n=1 Tax=Staphylothermus marinus TaxID=2280 RepID=A0A7C4NN16_STAMA